MGILFSVSDAVATCYKDAALDSGAARDEFARKNKLQVYSAVNTWLLLMADCGVPVGLTLGVRRIIIDCGLRRVVDVCGSISDMLLEGLAVDQLPEEHCWEAELASQGAIHRLIGVAIDFISSQPAYTTEEKCRLILQILLYLERFTYIGGAPEQKASVSKFLDSNSRCRDIEYDWSRWPGQTIVSMLRQALSEMLTYRHWRFDETQCGFSSGSFAEAMVEKPKAGLGRKSPLAKYYWLSQYRPCLYGRAEFPLPGGRNAYRAYKSPIMTLVPKKFDVRRVIFPEDILMSYYAHGYLEALRRMLKSNGTSKFINEDDQSVNREFARVGSLTGDWATIDMSSASDTISKAMAFAMVPEWFKSVLLDTVSWYFSYPTGQGSSVRKLFTLYTSGNPMTWLFESVWFLAIGRVAASLCGFRDPRHEVFVYGDDMVVRREAYETTVELLESLGHTVNRRKSYGSGWFRESCGGWYYNGTDVTPMYWPRREVPGRPIDALPSLLELQHKAVVYGYDSMNDWLIASIEGLEPRMTRSTPESVFQDIWDPVCDPYSDDASAHLFFEETKHEVSNHYTSLAEHVAYYEYLLHGPMYDSYLDKVLGTSTSRLTGLSRYPSGDYRIVLR